MSQRSDDTELDALAAQVRGFPVLDHSTLAGLLSEARSGVADARVRLIEQQLPAVLAAALAHRSSSVDVLDLYQEGSVAATVAVEEYVVHDGDAAGLRAYVARVVSRHLDNLIEREEEQRRADARLVDDAELLQAAELVLRRELRRPATAVEVGARLGWSAARVDEVGHMLVSAREGFDEEILQYLDEGDTG